MTPALTESTKAFWSVVHSKRKKYPYWCKSHMTIVPELISKGYFQFIHLSQSDITYWGFQALDKRNEFQRRYSAEDWSP